MLEQRPGILMIGTCNVGKRTLLSKIGFLAMIFRSLTYYHAFGNKMDLLPGHAAHVEYRRHLQKLGESSNNSYLNFSELGISETEGSSLLGVEEPSWEIKKLCLEWCSECNVEYIEACASNAHFDSCLSVDGDSQGGERLHRALSAHMWPGMILKFGSKITEPTIAEKQELSEEDSEYEIEYEILSVGSAEPWDDTDVGWVSSSGSIESACAEGSVVQNIDIMKCGGGKEIRSVEGELQPPTSVSRSQEEVGSEVMAKVHDFDKDSESVEGKHNDFEDLEQLMSEIGSVRDGMRLMPNFQRREMAAMFRDSSGDERRFD